MNANVKQEQATRTAIGKLLKTKFLVKDIENTTQLTTEPLTITNPLLPGKGILLYDIRNGILGIRWKTIDNKEHVRTYQVSGDHNSYQLQPFENDNNNDKNNKKNINSNVSYILQDMMDQYEQCLVHPSTTTTGKSTVLKRPLQKNKKKQDIPIKVYEFDTQYVFTEDQSTGALTCNGKQPTNNKSSHFFTNEHHHSNDKINNDTNETVQSHSTLLPHNNNNNDDDDDDNNDDDKDDKEFQLYQKECLKTKNQSALCMESKTKIAKKKQQMLHELFDKLKQTYYVFKDIPSQQIIDTIVATKYKIGKNKGLIYQRNSDDHEFDIIIKKANKQIETFRFQIQDNGSLKQINNNNNAYTVTYTQQQFIDNFSKCLWHHNMDEDDNNQYFRVQDGDMLTCKEDFDQKWQQDDDNIISLADQLLQNASKLQIRVAKDEKHALLRLQRLQKDTGHFDIGKGILYKIQDQQIGVIFTDRITNNIKHIAYNLTTTRPQKGSQTIIIIITSTVNPKDRYNEKQFFDMFIDCLAFELNTTSDGGYSQKEWQLDENNNVVCAKRPPMFYLGQNKNKNNDNVSLHQITNQIKDQLNKLKTIDNTEITQKRIEHNPTSTTNNITTNVKEIFQQYNQKATNNNDSEKDSEDSENDIEDSEEDNENDGDNDDKIHVLPINNINIPTKNHNNSQNEGNEQTGKMDITSSIPLTPPPPPMYKTVDYIAGPISLYHFRKGNKQIYIFGDVHVKQSKCNFANTQPIDEFIEQTIYANRNTKIDVLLEMDYSVKGALPREIYKPGTYLTEVESFFSDYNCTKINKSLCTIPNVTLHHCDTRDLLTSDNQNQNQNRDQYQETDVEFIYSGTIFGFQAQDVTEQSILRMQKILRSNRFLKQSYLNSKQQQQHIDEYNEDVEYDETKLLERQFSKIQDMEIKHVLQTFLQRKVDSIHKQTQEFQQQISEMQKKNDIIKYDREMKRIWQNIRERIAQMFTLRMDAFLLSLLMSDEIQNAIVYVGSIHAYTYAIFLEKSMKYEKINFTTEVQAQCIDVSTFAQPFFT